MANTMYTKFKQKLLLSTAADLSAGGVNIKAVLVDLADYTPNYDTHEFLSDIAAGARVATSGNLANKVVTPGVGSVKFDADDVTFTAVTGDQSEAVVLYVDTGSAATSQLILLVDTATGLPATPTGTNITVAWNTAGIFTL